MISIDKLMDDDRYLFDSVYAPYCADKYSIFHDVLASGFKPIGIGEIGVRAGYGALMMLSQAPECPYYGFDNACYQHGGGGIKTIEWAKVLLSQYNVNITLCDTQKIEKLADTGPINFFHVDGDHSTAGVINDLNLVLPIIPTGGYILIDDYTYVPEVKTGVDQWLSEHSELKWKFIPTFRGDILISV